MNQRIVSLDIARALALFGMVIVNFSATLSLGGVDSWSWVAELLSGRAASLFVLLAGLGTGLAAKRATEKPEGIRQLSTTLRKRALALWLAGLAIMLVWPADILHYYGVFLFAASWLLTAKDRTLLTIAGILVLASSAFLVFGDFESGWNFSELSYEGFWTAKGFVRNLFLNGFHPVLPWLSFYLIGMVLGRRDWRTASVLRRRAALGACLVAGAHLCAEVAGLPAEAIPPTLFFVASGTGSAICALSLIALAQPHLPGFVQDRLAAVGTFALTHYLAHVLCGLGLIEALYGLGPKSPTWSLLAALIYGAAAIEISWWWKSRWGRGPLETLLRRTSG